MKAHDYKLEVASDQNQLHMTYFIIVEAILIFEVI
jgi:hypothetical protein